MFQKEIRRIEQWLARPAFLSQEQAFVLVAHELLKGPCCGTSLVAKAKEMNYSVSDTVLSKALTRFREKEVVELYCEKVIGRGRPRLMFSLKKTEEAIAAVRSIARYYDKVFIG